jgi:gamma-glutamyl:cysteine ligase YbdK (ATP-grasp superfamily)
MDLTKLTDSELEAKIKALQAVPYGKDSQGKWSDAKKQANADLIPLVKEVERRKREAERQRHVDNVEKAVEARQTVQERAEKLRKAYPFSL